MYHLFGKVCCADRSLLWFFWSRKSRGKSFLKKSGHPGLCHLVYSAKVIFTASYLAVCIGPVTGRLSSQLNVVAIKSFFFHETVSN